jgi:Uma2 family endonuclease
MPVTELYEDTIAELLEKLGDIPANRVLLKPAPGTATEEDVLRLSDGPRKRLCELIDGTLVEKAVGSEESIIGSFLLALLSSHVLLHDLGVVTGGDGAFRLLPDNVRYPDVSFIPKDDIPEKESRGRIWAVTPRFIVEVLSPSNTKKEIDRKLKDLFSTGCQLAWVIVPDTKTAKVYTSPKRFKEIDEHGTLDGGTVLHGFKVSLARLFASPDGFK